MSTFCSFLERIILFFSLPIKKLSVSFRFLSEKSFKQKNESFVFNNYRNNFFWLLARLFLFVSSKNLNKLEPFVSKIYSIQNLSFICFVFCLGSEKNALLRLGFMNKILFSLYKCFYSSFDQNFYILNVFVSFQYRIGSISKALLSDIFALLVLSRSHKICSSYGIFGPLVSFNTDFC